MTIDTNMRYIPRFEFQLRSELEQLGLRSGAVLAPMSGVTDVPFRRLVSKFGAGMVVSEMVASQAFVVGQEEMRLKAETKGLEFPVVQLAGRQPRWMGEAAKLAEASGAKMIDINMGCPAKRVVGGQSGSALMKDLDLAVDLIRATVQAVYVPVSLKMRLGWDQSSINAPELARRAQQEGICLVTVHGRTRCQFYKGQADWDAIKSVQRSISIPLIANGDLKRPEDSIDMLKKSGSDAVMIGRAAYGAPWIVGQTGAFLSQGNYEAAPKGPALVETICTHYEDMLDHYGIALGARHARKHLDWYISSAQINVATEERRNLLTSDAPEQVLKQICEIFGRGERAVAA